MATDSILGLFTDPYQYMQQQSQAQDAAAQRFAQMDPMQRAQYGIYKGAGQLGGGIAGALGVQDPALVRQSQRQTLLQGLDWNDPTSLANASRSALEMGDVQASRELAMAAEKAKAAQLEAAVKTSQITRNIREPIRNAAPAIQKLQEYRAQRIEAGASPNEIAEINKVIAAEGQGKGTNINISQKQEEAVQPTVDEETINANQRINQSTSTAQVPSSDGNAYQKLMGAKTKEELDQMIFGQSLGR